MAGVAVGVIVHGVVAVKILMNLNLPTGKSLALNPAGIHQIGRPVAVIGVAGVAEVMVGEIHNLNEGRVNESIGFCPSI